MAIDGIKRMARRAAATALLAAAAAAPLRAGMDIGVAREKAERFYAHEEWANALAMFRLILDKEPTDVGTYGRAIAVYGVVRDEEEQMELLEETQSYGLPLDAVFDAVKKSAYEIDEPQALERFMLLVKRRQPWVARNIDIRLARYYDSRNNAPKMIAMSDSLLAQNPNDASLLRIKARGRMLQADYPAAVELYKRVLELQPDDVDAMLNIGVYYYNEVTSNGLPLSSPAAAEARAYLEAAFSLQPTDHLRQLLENLNE